MEGIENTTSRGGTLHILTFTLAGDVFDAHGPSWMACRPPIKIRTRA